LTGQTDSKSGPSVLVDTLFFSITVTLEWIKKNFAHEPKLSMGVLGIAILEFEGALHSSASVRLRKGLLQNLSRDLAV
jgi:hypothetical protein